jgi:outer membrane protein assembly factor BamB
VLSETLKQSTLTRPGITAGYVETWLHLKPQGTLRRSIVAGIMVGLFGVAGCFAEGLATTAGMKGTRVTGVWLAADALADGALEKWKGAQPIQGKIEKPPGKQTPENAPRIYVGLTRDSKKLAILVVTKDPCVCGERRAEGVVGDCVRVVVETGTTEKRSNAAFTLVPQNPYSASVLIAEPEEWKTRADATSVPVVGGMAYELALDVDSLLRGCVEDSHAPGEGATNRVQAGTINVREVRVGDWRYPVLLDGVQDEVWKEWWTSCGLEIPLEGVEPAGTKLPAQKLAAIYGDFPSVDDLEKGMQTMDGEKLAGLVWWLGYNGNQFGEEILRKLLAHPFPMVREAALDWLAPPEGDTAGRRLALEIGYSGLDEATPQALVALNEIQRATGQTRQDALLKLLRHPEPMVVISAAGAMVETGNEEDLKALRATLEDRGHGKDLREPELRALCSSWNEMDFRLHPGTPAESPPMRRVERRNVDLPRFMPVDNNTVYEADGLLRQWPEAGPRLIWQAEIGEGYSSVAEVGGRAYTMGLNEDKPTAWCFESESGKELWHRALGQEKPDYLGCSPVVDGKRVFFSTSKTVVCLNASDGAVLWEDNRNFQGSQFSVPLVEGDLLLVPGDTLTAVDKKTGKVVWRVKGKGASPASPALQTAAGVTQIVMGVGSGVSSEVIGVNIADGQVLWRRGFRSGDGLCSSPVVEGARVLLNYIDGQKSHLTALLMYAPTNRELGRLKPLAVYDVDTQGNYANTMALWDGALFGYGSGGLASVEAGTGRTLWKAPGQWQDHLQLIIADGLLFVINDEDLVLMEVNRKGEVASRFKLPVMPSLQQPVLANGRLYIRGQKMILCYNVKR